MNADIHIVTRGSVPSTMSAARDLLLDESLTLPFAVTASSQSDGIGRQGRSWLSDEGAGLYVTFATDLQTPPGTQGMIALAVGIAICDTLGELGIDAGLKWPNDVLVGDRKIAGILIQSVAERPGVYLIGIGLNLHPTPALEPAAITVADLIDTPPETIPLLRSLATRLGEWLERYEAGDHAYIVDTWTGYAVWLGAEIEVIADQPISGTMIGIDPAGLLILETEDGQVKLASGDVRRGPRPNQPSYT